MTADLNNIYQQLGEISATLKQVVKNQEDYKEHIESYKSDKGKIVGFATAAGLFSGAAFSGIWDGITKLFHS